ncbi:dimethylamine monooxygenase subunit DmmA family protein [Blastococcus sp. SYSU DS1021]
MTAVLTGEQLRPRRTSVPSWPAQPPSLDLTGRAFLLVQVGGRAAEVVDRWAAEAREHGRPVRRWGLPGVDGSSAAALARRLDGMHVGDRVLVAGPEADVLALVALARGLGLLPEEITAFAVARGPIPVFCAHCETTARLPVAPGAEVDCPGCGLRLEVHEHASGHRGSYLASAVTAPGEAG